MAQSLDVTRFIEVFAFVIGSPMTMKMNINDYVTISKASLFCRW